MPGQLPIPSPLPREYRKYVTAELVRPRPVYNWFVFPHSFSKELVDNLLDRFDVPPSGSVLDLFVGAGTTVLACKERGISAWGYDILPLSVMITSTKVASYRLSQLTATWGLIRADKSKSVQPVDIPMVSRAFSQAVHDRLYGIREELQRKVRDKAMRNFFHLALLYILEDVSFTKKSGGWLRVGMGNEVTAAQVSAMYRAQVEAMLADVARADTVDGGATAATRIRDDGHGQIDARWGASVRDARSYSRSMVADAIITSPPYLNRHDYTRVFALELATGFVQSQVQLKHLRYNSIRSHVEARAPRAGLLKRYTPPQQLVEVKRELPDKAGSCDARVHKMIDGYFEDMYLVLHAARRQLRSGGKIAFVIGNVRFGGVITPVDEIAGAIGEMVGLRCTDILVARKRGNSAQQMRDYGKEDSRESIVIWQCP